jgi:hypothetical protein
VCAARGAAERLPAERVDELVREGLGRAEFHPSRAERAAEGFKTWRGELFGLGGAEAERLLALAVWCALGLGLALCALAVVRALLRRGRVQGAGAPPRSAAAAREARVAELLRRASEAEAAGDLVLALRLSFFAAVVGLGEAGALEYRDAWTNRELFERGRPSRAVRERLVPLVEELDRKSFGGAAVAVEDVRAMQRLGAALLAEGVA